jgi:hypothetical protein
MPRQNDDGRHPGRSAERHLRVRSRMRFTGHFESEVLAPAVTHPTRQSGVLGCRSRFAARPLGWSDLDRLLQLADGPAPCQISIPESLLWGARRTEMVGFAVNEAECRRLTNRLVPSIIR